MVQKSWLPPLQFQFFYSWNVSTRHLRLTRLLADLQWEFEELQVQCSELEIRSFSFSVNPFARSGPVAQKRHVLRILPITRPVSLEPWPVHRKLSTRKWRKVEQKSLILIEVEKRLALSTGPAPISSVFPSCLPISATFLLQKLELCFYHSERFLKFCNISNFSSFRLVASVYRRQTDKNSATS